MFAVVFAPPFAGGKNKPVAHVGHFGGPAPIEVGISFTPLEAINDSPHLEEFGFGVLRVIRAGQRPFGAGSQLRLKVTDVGVGADLYFEGDVSARIVVDLRERFVEPRNALPDGLSFAGQLRLKIGNLPDGIFVEQLLEPPLKARQVVGLDYETFEKLRNPDKFMKVCNGGYCIEWECGADLSADTIDVRWGVASLLPLK